MNQPPKLVLARVACATLAVLLLGACASTEGPDWTYAPLGPTPSGGAVPTPGSSPAGVLIEVATPANNPLAFVPNTLEATPSTLVTVSYNNNSTLEHNINFFDGTSATAPSLGSTARVFGPNNVQPVTFTTPAAAGDYFFQCDVHPQNMIGTLRVSGEAPTASPAGSPQASPAGSPAASPAASPVASP